MTVNEYKETACATPDDVDADGVSALQNAPQDSENLLGRVLAGEISLPLKTKNFTNCTPASLHRVPLQFSLSYNLGQHAARRRLVHCTSAFLANFPLFLSFKDPCQRVQSRTGYPSIATIG